MAVSTANFGKLSPEIQLAQAISEYEAILSTDEKVSMQHLKDRRPPDAIDVVRFTAVIDRTSQAGRRCVGTRFTNVLQAIQAFATVGDIVVGGTQNLMASGLWALVRFTLQMATNHVSFLEKLSGLFMEIGRSAPRYQNLGLVYSQSSSLQRNICEYLIILVQLCTKTVQFTRRKALNRVLVTTLRSFDSEFGHFLHKLKTLGNEIKEDVLVISAKSQQDEVRENSAFRSLIMRRVGNDFDKRRKLAAKLSLLDKCSVYDYGSSWRQMKKKGNTSWICDSSDYVNWRDNNTNENPPLVCFGKLGSGKTVLAANIAEDLIVHCPKGTVAYFFCRYDDALSLKAKTIIGSLIRQLADFISMDSLLDSVTQWSDIQRNFAKRVAQMYLEKTRRLTSSSGSSSFDFRRALMEIDSGINNQQSPEEFLFLEYAKEYWLDHSKEFDQSMGPTWILWQKLINEPPAVIGNFPWGEKSDSNISSATFENDLPTERTTWAFENRLQAQISIVLQTNRAGFLGLTEKAEETALKHEIKGEWDQTASIRETIVESLKPAYSTAPLDLFRAMWNLALSYQAIERKQDMLEALLTDLFLKFKEQNRPLVYNVLDFSMAFQIARANARYAVIAKQLLIRALLLSRELLGETDGNTKQLLHDLEQFEKLHLTDEEFQELIYSVGPKLETKSNEEEME